MTTRTRVARRLRIPPRALGYVAAVVFPGVVTAFGIVSDNPYEHTGGRLYLLAVALVAFVGGLVPALAATVLSFAGLVLFFRPAGETFEIADPDELASLASFIVVAVVISELLTRREAAQREAAAARERAERLQSVTAALVDVRTTDEALDVMLDQGIAASKASRGAVALLTPDEDALDVAASRNYPTSLSREFGRFGLDSPLPLADAVRSSEPIYMSSRADRDARYPHLAPVEETFALAVLPLLSRGGALGAFALSFDEERDFAPEEREVLETIARQCAQAMERTRLYEAEAATRAELALQKAILEAEGEAADDGILLVSPEGQMLSVNRRFVELWDIPEELIGGDGDAAALRAIEPKLADARAFYERVAHLSANPDEQARDELDLVDGRIFECYTAPVRSPDGGLFGRVWYFSDITELRRGEEIATVLAAASDLLASTTEIEAVLQLVVRLPIPRLMGVCSVYLLGEDGTLRLAAAAHTDPAKEELIRELHRRYAPEAHDPIRRALETKESVPIVGLERAGLRALAHDPKHLELIEQIVVPAGMFIPLVAHGLTYGVLGVGLTPRRKTIPRQKELFAEELARRIAIALDNARLYADAERRGDAARSLAHVGDGVILLDGESRLRYWNPAAAGLLGLRGADMGRPVADAFEGWQELAAQLDGSGGARTVPVQLGEREHWLSVSAVRFDEGSVYALRDVTEERTLEGMRADFVTTASHELRTPLTAVYGAARTLLRDDIGLSEDDRTTFLRMIAAESERLAGIVDAILLAGSLESGRLELAREPCDVVPLADDVLEAARHRLPERLSLSRSTPPGPVLADCDEGKLRQVLVNLVDNAIKYSPDGGEVELALEPVDSVIRFAVRDRGLGIPPPDRERVFDKFFRLDPNLRRGIGGTGLGLYICRELVRRMDGRIWVDAREGGGSVFYVELPAVTSSG